MTRNQSQKLNVVQKTIFNQKGLKFDDKFVTRAMGVTVKINKINLAGFHCETISHCFIQLDRTKFAQAGRQKSENSYI